MTSNSKPKTERRKKTISESAAPAPAAAAVELSRADIARKAYELYCARGGRNGSEVDDWLRAERELLSTLMPAPRRRTTRAKTVSA